VSAEPAAVLARLLVLPLRSVLDAAEAAFLPVTLGGAFRCESAEPAADLAALLVDLLRSTLEAAVAALLLVTSLFFAIVTILCLLNDSLAYVDRCNIAENHIRDKP